MYCDSTNKDSDNANNCTNKKSPSTSKKNTHSTRNSWANQVRCAENGQDDSMSSFDSSCESNHSDNARTVKSENPPQGDIDFKFLDSTNGEKFGRLVKEDKLKMSFKRRHSPHFSRSASTGSSKSDCGDDDNDSNAGSMCKDEKRARQNSYNSSSSSSSFTEHDPAVLSRRQKQIDYGKNTVAYERYMQAVPKANRTRDHPKTPNKFGKYSRRAFDGLIKIWRKQLHHYDPPINDGKAEESSDESDSE